MVTKCAPVAFRHTTPVFEEDEKKAVNFGSGVFARIDGHPFLLSAAHVDDRVRSSTKTIGICQSGAGKAGVKLLYEKSEATDPPVEGRNYDMIDMAAYRLTDEVANLLNDRFMSDEHFEFDDKETVGSQYLVCGFPASGRRSKWVKPKATAISFEYLTSIYRMDRGTPQPSYNPDIEIVVNYSRNRNRSLDGRKVHSADPHGMSGCGIWRLFAARATTTSEWTSDRMRLVGIVHTWNSKLAIIRGTRIRHFVDMVRDKILKPV
jgi:hypothetical protein